MIRKPYCRRYLNTDIRQSSIYLDPDIILGDRPTPGTTASGFTDPSYVETTGYIHPTEAGHAACAPRMQEILSGFAIR